MTSPPASNSTLRSLAFWASISLPLGPPAVGIIYQTISGKGAEEFTLALATWWLWAVLGIVAAHFAMIAWQHLAAPVKLIVVTVWAIATVLVFANCGWEAALTFAPASIVVAGLAFTWCRSVSHVLDLDVVSRTVLFVCGLLLPFSIITQPLIIYWAMYANVRDPQRLWQPLTLIALSVVLWIVMIVFFVKAFRAAGRLLKRTD